MTEVLRAVPRYPNTAQRFAKAVSAAGSTAANEYLGYKENEAIKNKYGIDLQNIRDPQARQTILQNELNFGRKMRQANASGNVQLSPEESAKQLRAGGNQMSQSMGEDLKEGKPESRDREPIELPKSRQQLPEFATSKKRSSPKQEIQDGQQKLPGNFPQEQTTGQYQQVKTPQEVEQEGHRIAEQYRQNGTPISDLEGIQVADQINNSRIAYNQNVETERRNRASEQERYGKYGVDRIENVLGKTFLTDEMKDMFRREGEEASKGKRSEAEIQKELSQKAADFGNQINSILKSPARGNLFRDVYRKGTGSYRSPDKMEQDLKIKIQPLLDKGLYDTSRKLLSALDYSPEQVEGMINDLGENAKRSLASSPKFDLEPTNAMKAKYNPEPTQARLSENGINQFRENLKQTLTSDPTANLVLLRKAYEDKNVPWDQFKDALDELIMNGDIELDPDQMNSQFIFLSEPPLNALGKILHNLNLRGR